MGLDKKDNFDASDDLDQVVDAEWVCNIAVPPILPDGLQLWLS